MDNRTTDTILGEEKIGKLLAKLSLPATIAMLVNGLYNLVDTIFVGQGVGADAIGGLTITFPFQMLILAFGGMIGTGAASVISRKLGEQNKEAASRTAGNAMICAMITGILFSIAGYIFMDHILFLFGATAGLINYAKDYLSVILIGNTFITFAMTSNNIIRSEGKAKIAMVSMLIGAVGNIALDPIFIFGFNMGIKGAALATVIAQGISFLYLIIYFTSGKSTLALSTPHFKPDFTILKEIIVLGIPAFIRQGGMSLVTIIVNNALGIYGGDLYISIYGVVMRILLFVLMPLFGVVQGFQPIAGYNYGAKKLDRVREVLKKTLLFLTTLAVLFFIIMFFFPDVMFKMFSQDQALIKAGIPVLRTMILIVPFLGIQIAGAQYFLAVGKAGPSFFLGLSRQFIFLLPLMIIFPRVWGINGVIAAFPIADFLSTLTTGIWLFFEVKQLKIQNC